MASGNAFQKVWDSITDFVNGGGDPTMLAILTCSEQALAYVQANAQAVAGIFSGDVGKVAEGIAGALEVLGEELLAVLSDIPWVSYGIAHLTNGTFAASAGLAGEWHRVTHKGSCSTARTTTGRGKNGIKVAGATALGMAIAAYGERNGIRNADDLNEWHELLLTQGMDGLKPKWNQILDGYRRGRELAGQFEGNAPTKTKTRIVCERRLSPAERKAMNREMRKLGAGNRARVLARYGCREEIVSTDAPTTGDDSGRETGTKKGSAAPLLVLGLLALG